MGGVLIFRSERMRRTGARSTASGTSSHMQSWADCITGTHESSFWKRQEVAICTAAPTVSETPLMFRLAFYEGQPILNSWRSLRALHQNRRRSWLNGKSEWQHVRERRRRAVRRASLPNPCEGRQRNAPVPRRRQENG